MKLVFALGVIFLALGLTVYYSLPPLISIYVDTQIALKPTSQSYPLWRELPVPVYQKFYFFNVTNAHDIEANGAKPQLAEIGPFTYRLDMTKADIEADDIENTLRFKHIKNWFFEPDLSIADHRLQLVVLNAPLAITLSLIQTASPAIRYIVTFSLDGLSEGFFTRRSVKQLLFDGYPDLLTTFGPLLNAEMLSQGGHFGYMNARNASEDGRYEIYTGADDIHKLNTIQKFNGAPQLSFWAPYGECNSLSGATIGEMFPPQVTGGGTVDATSSNASSNINQLRLFQPDFCRVWPLNAAGDFEEPSSGLLLRRFVASRDVLRNSTDLPSNSCFYPHKKSPNSDNDRQQRQAPARSPTTNTVTSNPQQHHQPQHQQQHHSNGRHRNKPRAEWPAGVFSLAPCKFNAPIYMSMPHFLDADPYFSSQVRGLESDKSRHEFYVDVEPRTGSPVSLAARVQINVAISKPQGLVRFRNVPDIMFPVFWQELSVNVTEPIIDRLVLASKRPAEATLLISYTFFYVGALVLIIASIVFMYSNFMATKQDKNEPT